MLPDPRYIAYATAIPPVLGFFVLVFLTAVTLLKGRRTPANRLFAVLCLLGALNNADLAMLSLITDGERVLAVERLIYVVFVFSLPVYIQFVHRLLGIMGRRWTERLAWLLGFGLLPLTQTDLFIRGLHRGARGFVAEAGPAFHIFSILAGCTLAYCLSLLVQGLGRSADNRERNRLKYITAGVGISSLLIALNILPVIGLDIHPMGGFSFVPAAILAYGILRYDLLDAGAVIRRGIVYSILVLLLAALCAAGLSLIHVLFVRNGFHDVAATSLLLALMMVFLFQPIRERVQAFLDRLFFRGGYDARRLLRELSGELASLKHSDEVRDLLFASISEAIPVGRFFLLVRDAGTGRFRAYGRGEDSAGLEDMPPDHPLALLLEEAGEPVSRSQLDEEAGVVPGGESPTAFLDAYRIDLAVPMLSRNRLIGAILLGQKRSGALFVHEDLELLDTIANQAAIAIENAAGYEEIERMNRELERRIEERTAELRRMLEEKEQTQQQLIRSESLASIGQLVAGTAHELNNPLASASSLIESSLDELRERPVEGASGEVLDDLRFSLKELRRAGSIVRSLLDLSRQTQTYTEPVDLHAVVDDALRILYNSYKLLPVHIERRYAADLPRVEGNFANLGQVFVNIVKNALDALPGEGGAITITTATDGGREGNRVSVSFRDTGQGIPDGRLVDIFKPFFTTKEVGRGTGLGLYISHEIIKRHGGEILVRSEGGQGTEVTVLLPARRMP
ncbi:MAG: GAF domain-containing protein [Syntrophaceae bacterium]|nr:GAF domain-containing protein [Syntrophaceae bacterium]